MFKGKLIGTTSIGWLPVEIREVENLKKDGEELYGHFHRSSNSIIIRLRKGMSRLEKLDTLLHEYIHAIASTYGFNMEETEVRLTATALLQALHGYKKVSEKSAPKRVRSQK